MSSYILIHKRHRNIQNQACKDHPIITLLSLLYCHHLLQKDTDRNPQQSPLCHNVREQTQKCDQFEKTERILVVSKEEIPEKGHKHLKEIPV